MATSGGGVHTLGLASDGTVYAWGANPSGQLGVNSTNNSSVPTAVSPGSILAGKTIVAIAAGGAHSLALASDGTVYAWGSNAAGQLGNGDSTGASSLVPLAVSIPGETIVAIAAGGSHSLALATALVSGSNGASGTALVEVYEISE